LRCMPCHRVRLIAECLNRTLKVSSDMASHSLVERFSTSLIGVNSTSSVGLLNRFQGHTSWQISQPNAHLSNLPFTSSGISISFNSMVKYEIHLLPSTTLPGRMAFVGQASIHLVHVPHRSFANASSCSSSRSVINVAIKKNEPLSFVRRFPFLPIHPRPLRCAQLLSSTGAESTNPLPCTSPISSPIN